MCFFFKQKTAYELRSSDWSSDVCSSDLDRLEAQLVAGVGGVGDQLAQEDLLVRVQRVRHQVQDLGDFGLEGAGFGVRGHRGSPDCMAVDTRICARWGGFQAWRRAWMRNPGGNRRAGGSGEHTSDIQSLMRISYAVFCLTKKNINNHTTALPNSVSDTQKS